MQAGVVALEHGEAVVHVQRGEPEPVPVVRDCRADVSDGKRGDRVAESSHICPEGYHAARGRNSPAPGEFFSRVHMRGWPTDSWVSRR